MWCDNCLLIFPLRHGAMALAAFIAFYSLAGGIFLFYDYPFFFFVKYEGDIYAGIAMTVMASAIMTLLALSTESYMLMRLGAFLWPALILICTVRTGIMLYDLNKYQDRFVWECDNGGYTWNASYFNTTTNLTDATFNASALSGSKIPTTFCTYGFHSVYVAFALACIIDVGCQLYLWFLDWRYMARIRHYISAMERSDGIYKF
jgi:hypothetical protein